MNKFNAFRKDIKILKSHKLKNGFISITYVITFGTNTCSDEKTIEVEKKGGALHSLYEYYMEGIN